MQASPFVQLRELDSAIREIAKAQLAIKTTQEQLARRWRDLFIRGARRCDGSVTAQIAAVVRARSVRGCHTSTPTFPFPPRFTLPDRNAALRAHGGRRHPLPGTRALIE
jgi:hypothetical protein